MIAYKIEDDVLYDLDNNGEVRMMLGRVGKDLNCEQPIFEGFRIGHCVISNQYWLIVEGKSFEFTPTDEFLNAVRLYRLKNSNNYRKMHHLPIRRYTQYRKVKVK